MRRKKGSNHVHRRYRGSYFPTSRADWKCHLKLVSSRKASRPTGGFYKKGPINTYGLSRGPKRGLTGPNGASFCQLSDTQMKLRGDGPIPTGGAWRTSENWWVGKRY